MENSNIKQIKILDYVDTGDSFRLVTDFQGSLINCKHYCLKLVKNLPIMKFIEPVFIQLGATTLIPVKDCLANDFMSDSLKGCTGTFDMRFGSNPNHFQIVSKHKRSSYYSQAECIGLIVNDGASIAPVTTAKSIATSTTE